MKPMSDRLGTPEDYTAKSIVLLSVVCDAHFDQIKTCELKKNKLNIGACKIFCVNGIFI